MSNDIRNVVIAGGGTAGWMTASLMRKVLPESIHITLIESEQIGIVGVGEATIPPIHIFNNYIGLDEKEFLIETKATIKLAIKFEHWKKQGEHYFHTFGAPGANIGFCSFQHYFFRAKKAGLSASIWDFDLNYLCSASAKFNKINTKNPLYDLQYAYHFDSELYGKLLRRKSEQAGVRRIEGIIDHIKIDPITGFIDKLKLKTGVEVEGDLFIDCTGQRGLLIKEALGVAYESWSKYLPADSAIAVPTERLESPLPYTKSIAHDIGWQWQIPLAHRNGNGIVYSSQYTSDDIALQTLTSNLHGKMLDTPKTIRFNTGRSEKQWHKNVIAIGMSSGFLEPLESTSIHLIQSSIVRLLKMFPNHGIKEEVVSLYNSESKKELEQIRDFIILHYHVNERNGDDFWNDMKNMDVPSRLKQKIGAFKESAIISNDENDIFKDSSWLQVMLGQGVTPDDYHPCADAFDDTQILHIMNEIKTAKHKPLKDMLKCEDFLKLYTAY
ncbi:tryptophan 7-halogenase [Colwellia sp. MB02u-18]|uniref:tryptophan halogenase family protein n=1 Tax=unclassified Colwellia TaxID=196834 RepID=UPI0015F5577C|nr:MULTISPECIES: tryptophan halogenase family protein [unclassified Colwellia]MBA6224194.1 tryptophan 7-halogenase [Colwellia sp. MB3u-45]MBA6268324.1 tryptophan 7-halogenase [Colwellia sp. MB3u-43]MBA6322724.1 tryptophan 7-halogenase [Colwellia sp. MB02u-19]MBA6323526.1 tryptophan 7-halogenase [Colwellia sp. MB02u-18]MBA6332867.1 tryptophan 7-halogenase [Colwellia sp. MB02u-12]